VYIDDLDQDGQKEIITAGLANNGSWDFGQLRIWKWYTLFTPKLLLAGHVEWYTKSWTQAWSVKSADIDNDGTKEIVTAGYANDGIRDNAQLRIWNWNGTGFTLETSTEWYIIGNAAAESVFIEDVDADGQKEIITAGYANNFLQDNGQLRIWNWNGTTLTLEKTQEWFTVGTTRVGSVYVDDVDADGVKEIITAGFAFDGVRNNGQLRIWNWDGATLALEKTQEWFTVNHTFALSVFVDDVDSDSLKEIVTGGYAFDNIRDNGQLRIWNWDGISLALEKSQEWFTVNHTHASWALYVEDVDSDGVKEIITGGLAFDGTQVQAQLRTWNWISSSINLEASQEWYTKSSATEIVSVGADDIDNDGINEIVTAGYFYDGKRHNGQLRVWAIPVIDSLNVNIDVGATHFRGEIVEAYVQTSYLGEPVFPTAIPATLYSPGGATTSLTVQYVASGLFKIQYTIPSDAETGTYTIAVEASYKTNAKNLQGRNLKTFQISPALTQWNAWLITIEQDTGTIKTDTGLIKLNLTQINARITAIDDNIATIETNIGTIQADITTIDAESLPSIADTQANQGTSLYISIAIAAVAAIGAIGTLALILTKRKPT